MLFPRLDDLALFALPALAVLWTWWHHARVRRGRLPALRPLTGIATLDERLGEGVESGKPLHIATGTGQPGSVGPTAESLASLLIADRLADLATRRSSNVLITNGEAVNHAASRGTLRRIYRATGLSGDYCSTQAQLVAHETPIAYAAGVVRRYATDPIDTGVMVGDYGAEALLIAEEGTHHRITHIAGATNLAALPGLTLSTYATLVGEELWAAEAYLSSAAAPKARLLTMDALRRVAVAAILAGLIYGIVNSALNLGLPAL